MHTLCLRQTIYVVHHYRLGVLARALLRRISFMETMSNSSNGIAPSRAGIGLCVWVRRDVILS